MTFGIDPYFYFDRIAYFEPSLVGPRRCSGNPSATVSDWFAAAQLAARVESFADLSSQVSAQAVL